MNSLLNEQQLIERIFSHIDNKTTDLGDTVWQEPVASYLSEERFESEIALLRRKPVAFCPSAMLLENGSYVARKAAGTPLLVVRGEDGEVRAFINGCRHRGMPVASDSGCARSFVCPYHAWTYGLDGQLRHIPGHSGFPGVELQNNGLVEVGALEKGGLVYVNQSGPIDPSMLENTPDFFTGGQQFFDQSEYNDEANWKLLAETTMEGYHIKSLHKQSFYPYGLDNITVVENFGSNSRVIFPFRRIDKLRDVEPQSRRLDGMVTSVYQLFPNVTISVLSKHSTMTVFEPLSPSLTQMLIYRVTNNTSDGSSIDVEEAKRDAVFVKAAGFDEDREAACGIQGTLGTNANSHLTFGYFEKAIVHFHKNLAEHLAIQ
ncbi:aromatic ring-hydroxylating dioxygenase subunit alpha [Halieaceae bacterium IMCC14734]|uniref:Aromatic ring-hydroxylating dioxygenase subunit alpha n=1 Tax=Candidatus Litorirhabdus singularis TaxID=2518993 RepID=A0ABT3TFZ4_9GAMM|nr:SRPBCC family protein [Candidatus Litorirhabdus singularis]MCX2981135.1 aromatic ring-hydroxylating dioxygenase subunit alpha [Candidatus Litorirhabdus singularis]